KLLPLKRSAVAAAIAATRSARTADVPSADMYDNPAGHDQPPTVHNHGTLAASASQSRTVPNAPGTETPENRASNPNQPAVSDPLSSAPRGGEGPGERSPSHPVVAAPSNARAGGQSGFASDFEMAGTEARREEGAYPQRYVTDEQQRIGGSQPKGDG